MIKESIAIWNQVRILAKVRRKAKSVLRSSILYISNFAYPFLPKADLRQVENLQLKVYDIKAPHKTLDSSPKLIKSKWGGRTPTFHNYKQSYLDELSKSFNIYKGSPEMRVYRNSIYIPRHSCLYTSDGIRIDNTCLYRRNRGQLSAPVGIFSEAPERIIPPKRIEKISRPIIYAGYFDNRFGHFLCESIARLWYAYKRQDCPILFYSSKGSKILDRSFVRNLFDLSGLDIRRFVDFNVPVCLQEVIVPSPSFSLYFEGFFAHKVIPEKVAEILLSGKDRQTSQPLYFSRRNLSPVKRLVLNEHRLEEKLNALGAAIVYPEKLSFSEQITLINKHKILIGPEGSALHNILFDISDEKNLVCFTETDNINQNCLMLDSIKSVQSTYIGALKLESKKHKNRKYNTNQILDFDEAINGLKMIGLA